MSAPTIYRTCSGRGHGASHFSSDETKAGRRESLTITKAHEPRLVAESGQWFFLPARTSYPSPCEALIPFLGFLKARPVGLCFQHEEKPSNSPQKLRCPCTPRQQPSKHPRGRSTLTPLENTNMCQWQKKHIPDPAARSQIK